MAITKEMKMKLFERVLWLEHMGEDQGDGKLFDHSDYIAESNGAYSMLEVLGLGREYIRWAVGK